MILETTKEEKKVNKVFKRKEEVSVKEKKNFLTQINILLERGLGVGYINYQITGKDEPPKRPWSLSRTVLT